MSYELLKAFYAFTYSEQEISTVRQTKKVA